MSDLNELTEEGLADLVARMEEHLAGGARSGFPDSLFVWPEEPTATLPTSVDWIAFPERVAACVGRSTALDLLEVRDARVGSGGRRLQEEYAEWRTVRSDRGIERVDVTVETSDYWRLLAAHAPRRIVDLVGSFAGEAPADNKLLFGRLDPCAPRSTLAMREEAFAETMLDGTSPYNNGARAITCMVHPSNSIPALLNLLTAATVAYEVTGDDGVGRCPSCVELAPVLRQAAEAGRASDPLVVERMARLAFEGRRVALDVPAPLAISGVEHTRLRMPSGEVVPRSWFGLSRPMRPNSRFQRISLAVPPHEDWCVSDLRDVATEEKITSGAQIADLIQVSLYLLTTASSDIKRKVINLGNGRTHVRCDDIEEAVRALNKPAGP